MSIAEALLETGEVEIAFAGRKEGIEGKVIPERGWRFFPIEAMPLKRTAVPSALMTLLRTMMRSRRILRDFAPTVVVATGGYVAAGVAIAQLLRRGKVVLHEQNAVPGRTNRWLSRWACRVCITFQSTARYLRGCSWVYTGLPIRKELLQARKERTQACAELSLYPQSSVLLVLGGSQGAQRLNEWVRQMLPNLLEAGVQVLHQVGERNMAEYAALKTPEGYRWFGFLGAYQMGLALSASHLVLSRAGASTLNEIAVFGRAAVLVPYPYAYADHQWHNAQELATIGGAVVYREHLLDTTTLQKILLDLLIDSQRLQQMGEANRQWAREDAAQRVVQQVLEVASQG